MPSPIAKIFPQLDPPAKIYGVANSTDTQEHRAYYEKLLRLAVTEIVRRAPSLNENLPGQTFDTVAICLAMEDFIGDHIGGPLQRIAEQLDEDATESRGPAGSYLRAGE